MAPFRLKIWGIFTSFLFKTRIFFGFLCILDVAYLNCHPFLPGFTHFPSLSSPHWGAREGRGDVDILIYAGVM